MRVWVHRSKRKEHGGYVAGGGGEGSFEKNGSAFLFKDKLLQAAYCMTFNNQIQPSKKHPFQE